MVRYGTGGAERTSQMRGWISMAVLVAFLGIARQGAASPVAGINMGAPVWQGVPREQELQAAIATGSPYIRVNFRVDQWSSPTDTTKIGGRTFFDVYDHVVDEITSHGLEVYGLVSNEIVAEGHGDVTSQAWEDEFAKNSLAVIERYRDRVRVWESINEPNNSPAVNTPAFLLAPDFARLHGRLYRDVKVLHPNDACWNVTMLTGPILSLEGQSSASYFADAVTAGRTSAGPWKDVVTATGSDPIDGVAYHIYAAQGSDETELDTANAINANMNAFRAMLDSQGLSEKKIWISEVGYQSNNLTEAGQATRLDTTFNTLAARGDVASVQWFTVADFNSEGWGLFRLGGFALPTDARPARASFVAQTQMLAPDLAARLEVDVPKQAIVGETIVAKVKATNLGKQMWPASGDIRLGSANGCPWASATNTIDWKPAAGQGYVHSATDARQFTASSNAQGQTITIEVPIVASAAQAGKRVRFAARMVDELVTWFGSTVTADIDVLAAAETGMPDGGDIGDGGAASSASPVGGTRGTTDREG